MVLVPAIQVPTRAGSINRGRLVFGNREVILNHTVIRGVENELAIGDRYFSLKEPTCGEFYPPRIANTKIGRSSSVWKNLDSMHNC